MKVAVVQTDPIFGEVRRNINEAVSMIEREEGDLFVLPELFNTGYNFANQQELKELSEPADGYTCEALAKVAQEKSCFVAYGFAERAGAVYNSAALVGPEGLLGIYRKVHLFFRENLFFSPGDLGFKVFDLPFGKVGIMICFDWIYPESARTLALLGAQLIVHPSNLVLPYCPDAMITRCLENRVFAATTNRVGREERGGFDYRFIGKSEIVSPRGEILTRMDGKTVGVSVVEIDLNQANDKKLNEINDLFRDRKPDQYRL